MADFFFVTRDPNVMGGKACIRDTQITISAVVALLTSGHQKDEVIQMLPALTREDLTEALAYVSRSIDDPAAAKAEERSLEPAAAAPVAEPEPPRAGPGPLQGSVAPAPLRKRTPMSGREPVPPVADEAITPPEVPQAGPVFQPAQPAPASAPESEAASIAENLHRMGPPAVEFEEISEEEEEPAVAPEAEESIELFHPAYPDQPIVTVSGEGLFDRRWSTHVIAWPDIESIERVSGRKTINITLRHPERYLAAMPYFKRLRAQMKMALNIPAFYLDTSSLAIRTKDLYYMATRLWHAHRGSVHFHHKRRIRIGKSSRDMAWEKCLPR